MPPAFLTAGSLWRRFLWGFDARARRFATVLGGVGRESSPPAPELVDRKALCEQTDRAYRGVEAAFAPGSVEKSRELLKVIGAGYPTPLLTEAYFENLRALLERETPLPAPGKLVIGLGTGRSGSTSLAARLGAITGSCSTHENPPLIFWSPEPEQVAFHFRRFAMLLRYHRLVADCAHWWINLTDELAREFPQVRFVGLVRDKYDCSISFARLKGFGRGSYNHWAAQPNGLWNPTPWDPTYPTFDIPAGAERHPDKAKWVMILHYWELYTAKMSALAAKHPERYLILRTECLDENESQNRLCDFVGVGPEQHTRLKKLNVKSTKDGRSGMFKV